MTIAKSLAAVATVVAMLATPFVGINVAHAKSVKCFSTKVPGTVATYRWVCTTTRP